MTIRAYPLQWPAGWKRCRARKAAQFGTTRNSAPSQISGKKAIKDVNVEEGARRVRKEMMAMGIDDADVVISTNLRLRLDGWPRGDEQPAQGDPGACVYWRDKRGETRCMAVDQYYRVADNLAAIAATLSAMRAIERHGGAEILDRAFTGFVALPSPTSGKWWEVLGLESTAGRSDVDEAYRRLRSVNHPDKGGDAVEFDRVQKAYEEATRAS